jgi:GH35 family endo-1,4-beta-xylanase
LRELELRLARSVLILVVLAIAVHHVNPVHADLVQIHGYVRDNEGGPVEDVPVEAFILTPPWTPLDSVRTDSAGHYVLSFDRPKRLTDPAEDYSRNGFPVYEGCRINVAWDSVGWMPSTDHTVNTENKTVIQYDFVLKPAGTVKLRAYDDRGNLIECFETNYAMENPFWPVYTTDLGWKIVPGQFVGSGTLIVSLGTPTVINIPWDVQGFGRVMLRADNGGEGFTLRTQGATTSINLNHELARTEFGQLNKSYQRYFAEGYAFSASTSKDVESARELFDKANTLTIESQKAHFADLSLNKTLWAAESMEFEKAIQDIEKHRKGDALLLFVDENELPISNADVSISQTTHDFLFGALAGGSLDMKAHELFKEAGMNSVLIQLYWRETEPSLGQHVFPYSLEGMNRLRSMGLHVGAEGLIVFEPSQVWTTGLYTVGLEDLKREVYQHVYALVSKYSDYVDYWIVVHNTNTAEGSLGLTREEMADVIKTGVAAVRTADPTAELFVYMGHICGWEAAWYQDEYTLDPYSYLKQLDRSGVNFDGVALQLTYGSVNEWGGATEMGLYGLQSPYFFRDLSSISRLLDWYDTLSKPIHITEFNVPGDFESHLGYWHRRSWDEKLKTEWIERFYTIAFSKPLMKEITYWEARDQYYMKANRGLLDAQNSPRESYYALKGLITGNWTTRLHATTDADGQVKFRGFAGNYAITIATKNGTFNSTIHVNEQATQAYTIETSQPPKITPQRARAEQAVVNATKAVNKAKTEGRTIFLDKAEGLLRDSQKALSDENYDQATLLAEEANQAADNAITWLVMPMFVVVAGVAVSVVLLLRKRRKKTTT